MSVLDEISFISIVTYTENCCKELNIIVNIKNKVIFNLITINETDNELYQTHKANEKHTK